MKKQDFIQKYNGSRINSELNHFDLFDVRKVNREFSAVSDITRQTGLTALSSQQIRERTSSPIPFYLIKKNKNDVIVNCVTYSFEEFRSDFVDVLESKRREAYRAVYDVLETEGIAGKIESRIEAREFAKISASLVQIKANQERALFWGTDGKLIVYMRGDGLYVIKE